MSITKLALNRRQTCFHVCEEMQNLESDFKNLSCNAQRNRLVFHSQEKKLYKKKSLHVFTLRKIYSQHDSHQIREQIDMVKFLVSNCHQHQR